MEAEIGGMQPQARDQLRPPEVGRGEEAALLNPVEGAQPCCHLGFWTSSLQDCWRAHFCLVRPPSLWLFVIAALENKYGERGCSQHMAESQHTSPDVVQLPRSPDSES